MSVETRPSHESDSISEPTISGKEYEQDRTPQSWLPVGLVSEVELLMAMTFFGIAGSMGRNGLVQLLEFQGLGSSWPNFTGCFLIAFAPALVDPVMTIAICTGFCGAMTSFSELITDIFLQSTSPKPNWPDYGYGVPLFMARLLEELSCCFAAYMAGSHLGKAWKAASLGKLSENSERLLLRGIGVAGVMGWAACIVTSIVGVKPERRWWALNGVFAPFGVFLRYYLSKKNTTENFKWGTFAANMFGTFVACVLQTCVLLPNTSLLQSQILMALQRGFCGCLTTISTFVKEMNTMRLKHAYFYGVVSIFLGYSFAFIIIGSYKWAR